MSPRGPPRADAAAAQRGPMKGLRYGTTPAAHSAFPANRLTSPPGRLVTLAARKTSRLRSRTKSSQSLSATPDPTMRTMTPIHRTSFPSCTFPQEIGGPTQSHQRSSTHLPRSRAVRLPLHADHGSST